MSKKKDEVIVVLRVKKTAFQKAARNWQDARTPEENSERLIEWISVCETQKELDSVWPHVTKASEKNAFRAQMTEISSREKSKAAFLSEISD